MTRIDEIAPEIFRISTYIPEFELQFNQFLVRDQEPLLYHTAPKQMFPLVYEAVARLIEPKQLRWISFSHFEADECGALNEWLEIAPQAQVTVSFLSANLSVNDFANRPARILQGEERLKTGQKSFQLIPTPHVPHNWEASMLFEENTRTLFCSDLFHQGGDVEPLTNSSVMERTRQVLSMYQNSPFADYVPFRPATKRILQNLAELNPSTMAVMHGSSFVGDGSKALVELGQVWEEVLN